MIILTVLKAALLLGATAQALAIPTPQSSSLGPSDISSPTSLPTIPNDFGVESEDVGYPDFDFDFDSPDAPALAADSDLEARDEAAEEQAPYWEVYSSMAENEESEGVLKRKMNVNKYLNDKFGIGYGKRDLDVLEKRFDVGKFFRTMFGIGQAGRDSGMNN